MQLVKIRVENCGDTTLQMDGILILLLLLPTLSYAITTQRNVGGLYAGNQKDYVQVQVQYNLVKFANWEFY